MPATLPVSYTSVTLMLATLAELGSVTTITSALLAHYAGKAEAEMNARLARAYAMPIAVNVPVLTAIATDLACYHVLSRKPLAGPGSKSDPWLERFKEVRELLESISKGELPLTDVDGSTVDQRTDLAPAWSTTRDQTPTMSELDAEDWIVDPDKIDSELDKRDL